jgi:Polymer-forming cytoskeletal
MPHQPIKGDKQTLIEQGTEFKGVMTSTCPVVVNGRIEGETGTAVGVIKAERLSSRGSLSGNIDAGDLYLSGTVGSKTVIKARNLEVKLTPEQGRMELTFGECILDVGDEPSKERRVDLGPRASSLSGAAQLPVTRSTPPAAGREERRDVAPAPLSEGVMSEFGDAAKSSRAPTATGNSISKPPPAKKGQRDSVPPGA